MAQMTYFIQFRPYALHQPETGFYPRIS